METKNNNNNNNSSGLNILILKIEKQQIKDIKQLIKNQPNLINECNKNGNNSLIAAVKIGRIDVIELLLKSGVDYKKTNKQGKNSVYIASYYNRIDALRVLLKIQDIDYDLPDKRGWTPVMIACYHGFQQILHILIQKQINLNQKNKMGQSLIDIAKNTEIKQIIFDSLQSLIGKPCENQIINNSSSFDPILLNKNQQQPNNKNSFEQDQNQSEQQLFTESENNFNANYDYYLKPSPKNQMQYKQEKLQKTTQDQLQKKEKKQLSHKSQNNNINTPIQIQKPLVINLDKKIISKISIDNPTSTEKVNPLKNIRSHNQIQSNNKSNQVAQLYNNKKQESVKNSLRQTNQNNFQNPTHPYSYTALNSFRKQQQQTNLQFREKNEQNKLEFLYTKTENSKQHLEFQRDYLYEENVQKIPENQSSMNKQFQQVQSQFKNLNELFSYYDLSVKEDPIIQQQEYYNLDQIQSCEQEDDDQENENQNQTNSKDFQRTNLLNINDQACIEFEQLTKQLIQSFQKNSNFQKTQQEVDNVNIQNDKYEENIQENKQLEQNANYNQEFDQNHDINQQQNMQLKKDLNQYLITQQIYLNNNNNNVSTNQMIIIQNTKLQSQYIKMLNIYKTKLLMILSTKKNFTKNLFEQLIENFNQVILNQLLEKAPKQILSDNELSQNILSTTEDLFNNIIMHSDHIIKKSKELQNCFSNQQVADIQSFQQSNNNNNQQFQETKNYFSESQFKLQSVDNYQNQIQSEESKENIYENQNSEENIYENKHYEENIYEYKNSKENTGLITQYLGDSENDFNLTQKSLSDQNKTSVNIFYSSIKNTEQIQINQNNSNSNNKLDLQLNNGQSIVINCFDQKSQSDSNNNNNSQSDSLHYQQNLNYRQEEIQQQIQLESLNIDYNNINLNYNGHEDTDENVEATEYQYNQFNNNNNESLQLSSIKGIIIIQGEQDNFIDSEYEYSDNHKLKHTYTICDQNNNQIIQIKKIDNNNNHQKQIDEQSMINQMIEVKQLMHQDWNQKFKDNLQEISEQLNQETYDNILQDHKSDSIEVQFQDKIEQKVQFQDKIEQKQQQKQEFEQDSFKIKNLYLKTLNPIIEESSDTQSQISVSMIQNSNNLQDDLRQINDIFDSFDINNQENQINQQLLSNSIIVGSIQKKCEPLSNSTLEFQNQVQFLTKSMTLPETGNNLQDTLIINNQETKQQKDNCSKTSSIKENLQTRLNKLSEQIEIRLRESQKLRKE